MKALELTGRRFGRLTVIGLEGKYPYGAVWRCRCDCGAERKVTASHLHLGRTKSCGCLRVERSCAKATKHGLRESPMYSRWSDMLSRCYDVKDRVYRYYGARGITVCPAWHDVAN